MIDARWLHALVRDMCLAGPPIADVVAGSTPVVSFGDVTQCSVVTVGLNPSSREFRNSDGLLRGSDRRLATLESLGLETLDAVDDAAVAAIVDGCVRYFSGNPYMRWFRPLDELLTAAGHAYSGSGADACHLDLSPWATSQPWGKLGPDGQRKRAALKRQGVPWLIETLAKAQPALMLLNGAGVIDELSAAAQEFGMAFRVRGAGSLHVGAVSSRLLAGRLGDTQALGWRINLQSSFGVTVRFRRGLAEWIGDQLA